ncbi:unnamed protein product [Calicophoron daubneyi]|uniref:EGF-like domain-containing protein n=1 Tax=Calicophoron daubneyi TaxID=300641 RepID=A0AAV2TAX8_CALDB
MELTARDKNQPISLIRLLVFALSIIDVCIGDARIDIRIRDAQIKARSCASVECTMNFQVTVGGAKQEWSWRNTKNNLVHFGDQLPGGLPNMFTFHTGNESKLPKVEISAKLMEGTKVLFETSSLIAPDVNPTEDLAPFSEVRINKGELSMDLFVRGFCTEGFRGPSCNERCPVPPVFDSTHVDCDEYNIYCRKGWTGLSCQLRDPCTLEGLKVCQNEAFCIPTYTPGQGNGDTATFQCICQPGWIGPLCSVPEMSICRNANGTFERYHKLGYRWEDDGLQRAIRFGDDQPSGEPMSRPWSLLRGRKQMGRNFVMWRTADQQEAAGVMWRLYGDSKKPSNAYQPVKLTVPAAPKKLEKRQAGNAPRNGQTWKLVTNMEPLPPLHQASGRTIQCPTTEYKTVSSNGRIPATVDQLLALRQYEWMRNCYNVPCLMFRTQSPELPLTELYTMWAKTLNRMLPTLKNVKPKIDLKLLAFGNESPITAADLHASVNGIPIPEYELIKAFYGVTLPEWEKTLPAPVYRPAERRTSRR